MREGKTSSLSEDDILIFIAVLIDEKVCSALSQLPSCYVNQLSDYTSICGAI